MKKILVIGANGFVGRRILDNLSENGACEVFGCYQQTQKQTKKQGSKLNTNNFHCIQDMSPHN